MTKKTQVANEERVVREAAVAFYDAIRSAEQAGYRVTWPHNAPALLDVSVSEVGAYQARRAAALPVSDTDLSSAPSPAPEPVKAAEGKKS